MVVSSTNPKVADSAEESAAQRGVDETIAAAEQALSVAFSVREAEARKKDAKKVGGVRIPPTLKVSGGISGLAAFAAYKKGSLAPWWLFQGVCAQWGFDTFTTELRLITVSENATYVVLSHGKPCGVIRVSQPNYAGGPIAIASELAWINALQEVEEVNVVESLPTSSGFAVAEIMDESGAKWSCVRMNFVEGVLLEDMPDSSFYYHIVGRWSALLHSQARAWKRPDGFYRFSWSLSDMVGEGSRWGRWEGAELDDAGYEVCKQAETAALAIMLDVPITKNNWGLVHAGLTLSNVIVDENGGLTFIDFDDAGFSYFLYDFAAALSFVEHESCAQLMAQEWIAGYREISPLSAEELLQACALSMLRRLQTLGWTTNHYADSLPDGLFESQASGTVYCARRFLENPMWLLD